MCAMYFVFLAALLAVTNAAVFPGGKCDLRHITPISLDPKSLLGTWVFLYLTDDRQTTNSIDHITCVITQNNDHTMKKVTITVLKDKSSSSQEYTLTVVDDVIIEDAIDNVSGKRTHFHLYPLATTSEGALLIYRCTDFGRLPVDIRYIVIPKGKTLSDESLKHLLQVDKKGHFKGKLIELPNQLS